VWRRLFAGEYLAQQEEVFKAATRGSMPIDLDQFVSATSDFLSVNAGPDSYLWKDLRLFGENYADCFDEVAKALRVKLVSAIDIFDYIPEDHEVGLCFWLCTDRTIPDISLREFFAFLEIEEIHE
jgi:hypothetical protein